LQRRFDIDIRDLDRLFIETQIAFCSSIV